MDPQPKEREKEKMKEFVGKLWQNPVVQQTPIGKKENQILLFLKDNRAQIQKIFATPDYFPNLSWDDAIRLLLSELLEKLFDTISPKIDRIKDNLLNPEMMKAFNPRAEIDADRFKDFLITIMKTKSTRDLLLHAIELVSYGLFEKYLPEALNRRKTVFTELVRRDRITLDQNLIPAYLDFCLLFRPLYAYRFNVPGGSAVCVQDAGKDFHKIAQHIRSLQNHLNAEIGLVPDQILKPGIESHLSAVEFPETTGASRLIAIFMARAQVYDPHQKADRGAESPDKSWFNITRRNYKFHGFDIRMLEELHMVAGDKGW